MREDPDVAQLIAERFCAEGMRVLTVHGITRFSLEEGMKVLPCEHRGIEVRVEFDQRKRANALAGAPRWAQRYHS